MHHGGPAAGPAPPRRSTRAAQTRADTWELAGTATPPRSRARGALVQRVIARCGDLTQSIARRPSRGTPGAGRGKKWRRRGTVESRRQLWYLTRRRVRPLPLDRPRWLLKLGTARPSGDPTILLIRGKRSGSATVRADTITMDLETIVCFMTDRLCAVQIKIKVSRAWAAQSTLLVM